MYPFNSLNTIISQPPETEMILNATGETSLSPLIPNVWEFCAVFRLF